MTQNNKTTNTPPAPDPPAQTPAPEIPKPVKVKPAPVKKPTTEEKNKVKKPEEKIVTLPKENKETEPIVADDIEAGPDIKNEPTIEDAKEAVAIPRPSPALDKTTENKEPEIEPEKPEVKEKKSVELNPVPDTITAEKPKEQVSPRPQPPKPIEKPPAKPVPPKAVETERKPEDACSQAGFLEKLKKLSLLGVEKRRKIREDNLEKILTHFPLGVEFRNDDVQSLLNVSHRTAVRYLNTLSKQGKIVKFGKKSTTFYRKS